MPADTAALCQTPSVLRGFALKQSAESWDDLRYLLAVKRRGSFLHAGRSLGVATTTVARRLTHLESRLGVQLIDRRSTGVSLTAEGRRLVELAESIEARLEVDSRDLSGTDDRLEGVISVTAADGFMSLAIDVASAFRLEHPRVSVDLLIDARFHDVSRREADIGLRTGRPIGDGLLRQRLGKVTFGLYAADSYLKTAPRIRRVEELGAHDFVGFDGDLAEIPPAGWLREHGVRRFVMRANRFHAILHATVAGQGIAALPDFLVQREAKGLQRVLEEVELSSRDAWLVMHKELRRVRRISLFADFLAARFQRSLDSVRRAQPTRRSAMA